ncbi:MAG: hypothetical protein LBN41_02225 [Enterobacteriaceae bacterium]|nr:hypothetical protein [Enterobacteriaceae bacterium]
MSLFCLCLLPVCPPELAAVRQKARTCYVRMCECALHTPHALSGYYSLSKKGNLLSIYRAGLSAIR